MRKLKIGLIGARGRMGLAIAKLVTEEFSDRVEIASQIDRGNVTSFTKEASQCDCFVDVSLPKATVEFLASLEKLGLYIPYVIGCTGWKDDELKTVRKYAEKTCVVLSPNFSPGVTLFLGLIEQAAPILKDWGYTASIHETHHTRKVDAPSGTAKAMVERLGGLPTQVHSTRAGNIVGTHEVAFYGPGDVISFTHEALDRTIFARGAILAALWAVGAKRTGLQSMKEVVFTRM